jgi:hypothetical protein
MTYISRASGRNKALRWHRALWRAATIITMLAIVAISAWLGREPLLRGAASLWIVSDPVTHADAIVVLGGNYYVRPLLAADLYGRWFANKILLSQTTNVQQTPVTVIPTDTELNRTALLKLGVPAGAIESFGKCKFKYERRGCRRQAMGGAEWGLSIHNSN